MKTQPGREEGLLVRPLPGHGVERAKAPSLCRGPLQGTAEARATYLQAALVRDIS